MSAAVCGMVWSWSLNMQWVAVITHWVPIRDPPQNCDSAVVAMTAIHGYSLISVSDPPTILEVLFFPHLHPAAVVVAPAAGVDVDGGDDDVDGGDDDVGGGGVNVLEGGTTLVVIC